MEALTLPSWITYIMTGALPGVLAWGVWITRQSYKNEKEIAVNTANDQKVRSDLERIYNIMDETKSDNKDRFDRMEGKLDLFLNQEISFLKQISKG